MTTSEPLAGDAAQSYREELLRAFHIGPQDLLANRAGRLGPGQAARMRRGIATNLLLAGAIVIVLGGLVVLTADPPIQWWRWVMIAALALACLGTGAFRSRALARGAAAGVVQEYLGPIRLHLQPRVGWWLTVQGVAFHLPIKFWHLAEGGTYAVYVAPAAKLIVAIEPAGTTTTGPRRGG